MDREEIIRLLVLNSVCDDYEHVDQVIFPQVSRWGAKLRWTIERAEIIKALAWLIENGMARAYLLSEREPHSTELAGIPALDEIEDDSGIYFYITGKGMKLHREPNEVLDNLDWD